MSDNRRSRNDRPVEQSDGKTRIEMRFCDEEGEEAITCWLGNIRVAMIGKALADSIPAVWDAFVEFGKKVVPHILAKHGASVISMRTVEGTQAAPVPAPAPEIAVEKTVDFGTDFVLAFAKDDRAIVAVLLNKKTEYTVTVATANIDMVSRSKEFADAFASLVIESLPAIMRDMGYGKDSVGPQAAGDPQELRDNAAAGG